MQTQQPTTPQLQQNFNPVKDLDYLLTRLVTKYNPLQILSFNHICEKKQLKGCFGTAEEEISNAYYLLMVTEDSKRIENSVQDFSTAHYDKGEVIIIVHGKQAIDKSISEGDRFFRTVYQQGKLLYSMDSFHWNSSFEIPDINHNKEVKNQHFDRGMMRARGFFNCAKESLASSDLQVCAFLLHQAVEQYCIASISLHMEYRCNIHNLYRLVMLSRCFTENLYKIFLSTDADQQLFKKLTQGYIGCRYRSDFDISIEDLKKLVCRINRVL